ncbi:plasmid pRiA4b ORF-3 family protein [Robertmurraya andreesenii]|uniref:TnpR protein n=1 Tax=Anoxybacillus andreesenii TaxID=1325932 RepID=A0ABT9V841_9BACL|nr:plasmid pRiA4b ORF-3 family protein [Robertmurraya andreesenii]MDQ0157099.1 hypothetical protein [Robertmurraya andreesenii]
MIYQLKITLQHTSPPIWRRLLVDSNMTLADLHETIQIAFDWQGMHLHCFEARKTNRVSLTNRFITIGFDDDNLLGFDDYDYDETVETLSDWLVKEKDKLVYVYDFGDDWRHEIVLEKILAPEQGMIYPYCVKAMRGPAEEDSGGFVEEVEEVDPEELKSRINLLLNVFAEELSLPLDEQKDDRENHWPHLLSLAKQFNELAPWEYLDDDQIFAVQDPQSGEYFYCSIMGALGEEFGLAAFIGQDGLAFLKGIVAGSVINEDAIYQNHSIVLSFCNRDELTPDDYNLIKQAGFTFRGHKKWPMFRSLVPGYYPWLLSSEEVESFAIVLERALDICRRVKDGLIIEGFHEEGECLAQSAVEISKTLNWQDTHILLKANEVEAEPSDFHISELDLQRIKTKNKKFNVPLEIGMFYSLGPVQDQPSERPYFPLVFVAAERKNGMIVHHELLRPEEREKNIQSIFVQLGEKLEAVPREVWITRELHLILKPVLERLKISVVEIENQPIIQEIKKSMQQFYGF